MKAAVAIAQFHCLCAVMDGEIVCVCPEHERKRLAIADEIVRRVDTVTLCRVEEVEDIRRRALAGEFDKFFED